MKKRFKALAAILLAVLMGVLLAACGGGSTPAPAGSGAAPAGSGAAAPTGDKTEIVIGWVAPFTGPYAVFTQAFDWTSKLCLDKINADGGIYIEAYGKKLPVRLVTMDTESDPTKAAEAATKMVNDGEIDLLVGAWTPDTTIPVAGVAERFQMPCLCPNSPADSWASSAEHEWSWGMMFKIADYINGDMLTLEKIDGTNKKVGFMFDSAVDGVLMSQMVGEELTKRGYEVFDPGRYPEDTTDYTSVVKQIQAADCDIVYGNMALPQFQTAWGQFYELGYKPKVLIVGKALCFGTDVESLGEGRGENIIVEHNWDASYGYYSPLLEMSSQEIAEKFEEEFGTQNPGTELGYDIAAFEILQAALQSCADLEPETVRDAIGGVEMTGIFGDYKFNPEDHVSVFPITTAQWRSGGKWPYEVHVVSHGNFTEIPEEDPLTFADTTQK